MWPPLDEKWNGTNFKIIWGTSFTKQSFLRLVKWKIFFCYNIVANSYATLSWLCQIWGCYHGFCHVCGHFLVHMPWKPHKSILDRQICEGFIQTCCIASLIFFPQTSAHMMAQCKGIWIFEPFFIFFVFFKLGSNLECWPFIQNGLEFLLSLTQVHPSPILGHKMIFGNFQDQTMSHL